MLFAAGLFPLVIAQDDVSDFEPGRVAPAQFAVQSPPLFLNHNHINLVAPRAPRCSERSHGVASVECDPGGEATRDRTTHQVCLASQRWVALSTVPHELIKTGLLTGVWMCNASWIMPLPMSLPYGNVSNLRVLRFFQTECHDFAQGVPRSAFLPENAKTVVGDARSAFRRVAREMIIIGTIFAA